MNNARDSGMARWIVCCLLLSGLSQPAIAWVEGANPVEEDDEVTTGAEALDTVMHPFGEVGTHIIPMPGFRSHAAVGPAVGIPRECPSELFSSAVEPIPPAGGIRLKVDGATVLMVAITRPCRPTPLTEASNIVVVEFGLLRHRPEG